MDKPIEEATTFLESEYELNFYGEVVDKRTQLKFGAAKNTQQQYLKLQNLLSAHIQQNLIRDRFDMVEIPPVKVPGVEQITGSRLEPALISKNWDKSSKLLVIMKGAGAYSGVWCIMKCVLENIHQGSMLSYIERAAEAGYSILILHPNLQAYPNDDRNEVYRFHFTHVWKNYIQNTLPTTKIDIVAFSYGGIVVCNALNDFGDQFCPKINKIVFLDSVHRVDPHLSYKGAKAHIDWLRPRAVQFRTTLSLAPKGKAVAPSFPPNKEMLWTGYSSGVGCEIISSGTDTHDCVPFFVVDEVFEYLEPTTPTGTSWKPLLVAGLFIGSVVGIVYYYKSQKE